MRVKCPRCAAEATNPPEAYACPGCGKRLRWFPPSAFTTQLRLFAAQGWEQDELPVMGDLQRSPVPAPIPTAGSRPQPPRPAAPTGRTPMDQIILDAVAMIMAARVSGPTPGPAFAMGDLLYERSNKDLVDMVSFAAALAGWAFDMVDAQLDGLGTRYLQATAMGAIEGGASRG